jgi:hypothetical protein
LCPGHPRCADRALPPPRKGRLPDRSGSLIRRRRKHSPWVVMSCKARGSSPNPASLRHTSSAHIHEQGTSNQIAGVAGFVVGRSGGTCRSRTTGAVRRTELGLTCEWVKHFRARPPGHAPSRR